MFGIFAAHPTPTSVLEWAPSAPPSTTNTPAIDSFRENHSRSCFAGLASTRSAPAAPTGPMWPTLPHGLSGIVASLVSRPFPKSGLRIAKQSEGELKRGIRVQRSPPSGLVWSLVIGYWSLFGYCFLELGFCALAWLSRRPTASPFLLALRLCSGAVGVPRLRSP